MSIKVSVIMPIYNGEKYLVEAISSILNQTFTNFELLAINDGSTDSTQQILENFSKDDSRVKILSNEFEKGIVGGLNTGLKNAKGEFIARADADDILRPYRLYDQVKFLEENKSYAIVGGGYAPFNESGHIRDIFHPKSPIRLAYRFLFNTYFAHPSVMFRKDLVLNTIGNYPNVISEDYELFSHILRKYKGTNLQEIVIDYREHASNLSVTKQQLIIGSVDKTSKGNFEYYMGNLENYQLLKTYVSNGNVSIKDYWKIFSLQSKFLRKIRVDYSLGIFDKYLIKFILKEIWFFTGHLKRKLITKLRPQ